eukprot:scaffold2008_cov283-Pinguiococcus_pyrenoidosus.AAC.15
MRAPKCASLRLMSAPGGRRGVQQGYRAVLGPDGHDVAVIGAERQSGDVHGSRRRGHFELEALSGTQSLEAQQVAIADHRERLDRVHGQASSLHGTRGRACAPAYGLFGRKEGKPAWDGKDRGQDGKIRALDRTDSTDSTDSTDLKVGNKREVLYRGSGVSLYGTPISLLPTHQYQWYLVLVDPKTKDKYTSVSIYKSISK